MPLKTSLFNKEFFKQDFRNVGWISIVYMVGLLFTVPLQLVMALSDDHGIEPSNAGLFATTFSFDIQSIFLFSMPVLMAIFLFRYMHVQVSSDFVHSLPVRREKLFNAHIRSGIVLLMVPILLNSLLLLLFIGAADVSDFYTMSDLGYWTGLMIIVTLVVFMAGVFVGTLTGLSAVQGILTYILLVFPIGIFGLISYHISFYITGFSGVFVLDESSQRLSPIVDVIKYYPMTPGEKYLPVEYTALGIYLVLTVLFYFASKFIYKKRQLETASQAIAVTWLKPVFKYGMTICFALFGGMYFGETQHAYPWIACGYVLGGVFGYFLSTMLLEKTWRVFSIGHWKRLSGYGLAAGVLLVLIPVLWMGYEDYIPNNDEIESAFLGNSYGQYEDYINQGEGELIKSEEVVDAVRELHGKMVQEGDPLTRGGENFFIGYQLKNGDQVYRSYQLDRTDVEAQLRIVAETKEYKEMNYPVLNLKSSEVQKLNIHAPGRSNDLYIIDPMKLSNLLDHIKNDIYEVSYEEMVAPQGLESSGEVLLEKNEFVHFSLPKSYLQTMDWLKTEGLYDQAMLQAEDIDYVEIYPWNEYTQDSAFVALERMRENQIKPLKVENNEKINQALQANSNQQNGSYLVGIVFDKGQPRFNEVLTFPNNETPNFITDYFDGKE